MANGILKQLNTPLEVTLRDGLHALEDFTLQMAYAGTCVQFEILPIDDSAIQATSLKRVGSPAIDIAPPLLVKRQQRG